MSIDITEAVKAIQDMALMIDPEEDYLTIVAAEEKFAASEAKRKKELEDAHANLKSLAKLLEAARSSSTRPKTVPSAEAHVATLNELDRFKLSLAKSISDAEEQLASREAELTSLKEEARGLEDYDPALDHEKELDGTALRLTIYKGLGFEPLVERDGSVSKMLIRSQSGEIHRVQLTGKKGESECRHLWQLAAS
ncbi:hypothetical protein Moror_8913 [Moniliophthora roreri MCA 2997]|uniref:Kinetochore protein Spc24 n=1 Tax=Moniliophthora roreri (strain MCA 2997) TaxID=1381753 RepID=V2XKH4_MONRO|nr:hypothetical protein Moror_8913 [Moniliophthora roreri MCA 2997]KAI3610577.1 hypothetical protein WG66_007160 [Moniliophthora roreri]